MKKYFYTMVAGVSMMLAACTSQPQATEMTPQKKDIGLQLYSIRQLIGNAEKFAANQEQVLADLAKQGYTAVETANYGDGKLYGLTPEDFKTCMEKAGLKALSTHTTRGLSAEELKAGVASEETMKWWDECIAPHLPTPSIMSSLSYASASTIICSTPAISAFLKIASKPTIPL